MAIFAATLGSFGAISFLSSSQSQQQNPSSSSIVNPFNFPKCPQKLPPPCQLHYRHHNSKIMVSSSNDTQIDGFDNGLLQRPLAPDSQEALRQARRSSAWKAANAYRDSGLIYHGRVEGLNSGGLLVRFYSIRGFLPFRELSPVHLCQDSDKTVQDLKRKLVGSILSVKVIEADEEKRKLILSDREVSWFKYSKNINIGDIFEARVRCILDYGAFVHLHFPDGLYYLSGLIHISEVSWDVVQDVRDFLREGDELRVKVIAIDNVNLRLILSIKQLEEDPLLETLDKVIPQDGSAVPDSFSSTASSRIDPLPGLDTILEELLQEDGIYDARISRQGFEKRVVSQDLQLWLSNAPPMDQRLTLLARAGRQVQEIHLKTSLDQAGIKKAIQRVLERVP